MGRLIDADELREKLYESSMFDTYDDYSMVIDAIDDMPTVDIPDTNVGKWIPCDERLPKDRGPCLVTAYWHETYQTMVGCYWGKGEWWCVPWNNTGGQHELHVIAWMPLPVPYEEGEKMKDTSTTHVYCTDSMIKDLKEFKNQLATMRNKMANTASIDAVYHDKIVTAVGRSLRNDMDNMYDVIGAYLDYLEAQEKNAV